MAASSTPLLFSTALAKAAAFGQRPKGWRTEVNGAKARSSGGDKPLLCRKQR